MPSKKIVKQKQKQRQSVVVNVNLARAKARAKSSAKKSQGRSSAIMLPPPIYASPIDRLTPAMYNSQGQQIQQRSMEEVLRNFLSNQQKQNAPASTPNRLGSAPRGIPSSLSSYGSTNATANSSTSSNSLTDYGSSNSSSLNSLRYFPNQHSDSSLSSDNSLRTKTPSTSIYSTIGSSIEDWNSDNVSELSDNSYFSKPMSTESQYDRALASPFSNLGSDSSISTDSIFSKDSLMPTPFRNEEKTYLKASEPDYDINEPKSFSQNEARMSQGNIYESARRPERRPPVIIPNEEESSVETAPPSRSMYRQVSEESSVKVGGGEPRIFRPRKPKPLGDYQVVGEEEIISDNPFPERIYNKMMDI